MSKSPSAILSDALNSFNRAATLAFTAAQDQARNDVTQATADAREARRERDEAVNTLHAYRLEEQAWKEESSVWKAAVREFPRINHHLESITQLREEATQWKNQCLRLEETSRQEAVSWKEQFLRVEQERSKLAARVEALVAEQLSLSGHAPISATPYTPAPRYSAMGDLSASTRLQRTSAFDSVSPGSKEHPPPKSAPSTSKATSGANRTRSGPIVQLPTPLSENQRSARQRSVQDTTHPASRPESASNGSRQVLIRRVQAVVEVPVKEESIEPDERTLDASVSASARRTSNLPPRNKEPGKAAPRAKRKVAAKRAYVEIDEEESELDDATHSKQNNEEYQPLSEDEDDELLIGVERNRKKPRAFKNVPKPLQPTTRPLSVVRKQKPPPNTMKIRPSAAAQS
ncbi:hypothetical protein JVU11DRAFT_3464 [Chiua virens]|nr:hypothetical protein JVU11DRAFT_3464 [Chiua virens]